MSPTGLRQTRCRKGRLSVREARRWTREILNRAGNGSGSGGRCHSRGRLLCHEPCGTHVVTMTDARNVLTMSLLYCCGPPSAGGAGKYLASVGQRHGAAFAIFVPSLACDPVTMT